ncbi:MAG: cation-translocating P-type ATPase [Campylobacterales bacterium]
MENLPELWHHLPQEDVFEALKSDHRTGLSEEEVVARRRLFGQNRISQKKPVSPIVRFLLQFHNPLIYILLAAGTVALLLGETIDAGVIYGVVIANAVIGFIQESKAEAAIDSLKNMLSSQCVVLRGGKKQTVAATDLVPGDWVYLASGDKVGADLRLFKTRDLQIDESALTGESVSSQKTPATLNKETVLADRNNMAYAGTLVTYGQGQGIVIATGDKTETGKIAHLISEATAIETPLTQKIAAFSKILLWVILGLAAVTFAVGLLRGQAAIEVFMAAVALSVAAIPEGLPAVVTITLAIGVGKMASRNAIIRKLPAVETLGSTTVICSDKTGTLTQNRMTVQQIVAGGESVDRSDQTPIDPHTNRALLETLRAGLLCNDSKLVEKEGRIQTEGDPTEGALIAAAALAGLQHEPLEREHPRLDSIPFESDRQYMATLHELGATENALYVKGSLERILSLCDRTLEASGSMAPIERAAIEKTAHTLAAQGLRVLAFAADYPGTQVQNLDGFRQNEPKNLIFLGLQAMIDPPRQEAIDAVAACQKAGITVKMITGDHVLTASAIAEKIGIAKPKETALSGAELSALSDHELLEAAQKINVFARVAPEQKLKLVTALQARGQVVAMTGDGVNDAPALKQADIGVAMGITGTEVSKEAADMVLTDDNFASIAAAVEEGRGVYDNLIKFIAWILPTNLGQGLVIMLAILLGTALPVLPVQALWLNMTTAVFLGLMLAFEPKETGLMRRKPRAPDAPILSGEIIGRIVLIGSLLLIGSFGLFQYAIDAGRSVEEARTLAVTLFVVVQSFYLLNCRTLKISLFKISFFSNLWVLGGLGMMLISQLLFIYTPVMNTLFQSAPITAIDWGIMLIYGLLVLLIVEAEKGLRNRKAR